VEKKNMGLKYFQTDKKKQELFFQPLSDWGHPNPLLKLFPQITVLRSTKSFTLWAMTLQIYEIFLALQNFFLK